MRGWIIVLGVALAISGCQQAQALAKPAFLRGTPHTLSKRELNILHAGLSRYARNPDTALIEGVGATQDDSGLITVCGHLFAMTGLSGFVGDHPFMGTIAGGRFLPVWIAFSDVEAPRVADFCSKYGISIR